MNQSNLKKLQNLLKEKDIDIFVINRSDEYLNEYISPNAERLNFITSFSGSAGRAIITPTKAFLYVDGRYTFQANTQINAKEIQAKHLNNFWTDLEKILLFFMYGVTCSFSYELFDLRKLFFKELNLKTSISKPSGKVGKLPFER